MSVEMGSSLTLSGASSAGRATTMPLFIWINFFIFHPYARYRTERTIPSVNSGGCTSDST